MWHCIVNVAYPWLSDLQWALCSLIFGIRHSDFLELGTQIEKHNNTLLDEGKIERFWA